MEELNKQVRRAHRRMGLQRFAGVLGWCWFVPLLVVLGLTVVDRFYPLSVSTWGWAAGTDTTSTPVEAQKALAIVAAWSWAGLALGLGLLAAACWILASLRKPLGAAIEIDRRFGLKERVSSTLSMSAEQRQSDVGRALVNDAIHRVSRVDVAGKFSVSPGKRILLPLLPGLLAFLVAWLIDPAVFENQAKANADAKAAAQQIKKSTDTLRQKLAERRKKAQQNGLKDAEDLFKLLEEGSKKIASGEVERKKAVAKLNDLARQLQQRRKEIGGAENLKKQLNGLKNIDQGPAEKFAKAVRQGDFKQAAEELKKIQQQLDGSKLDEQQKQQLAKQLEQMQQKLNQLADGHQNARADLQKRIKQLRQAGQQGEADQLQEQFDKLMQQAPQMQQLQQLADQLGQCSKCLRNGQMADAANAINALQANLGDLQQQLDELEMLDDAFEQFGDAKGQILAQGMGQENCPMCGGMGCNACGGKGKIPGQGLGEGQGVGARPDGRIEPNFYDSQAPSKVGKGAGVLTDLVDGPNVKGNVEQKVKAQFDSLTQGSTDPLTTRTIPRKHRQHAREYFDSLREGRRETGDDE